MLPSKNFKDFSRKMLLHSPFMHHPQLPQPPSKHGISLDVDVVMIFSVLLCLLVFSIFVNCLIRCLLKCLIWFNTRQEDDNLLHNKVVNRGVDKRALKTFPLVKYSKEVKLQGLSIECVICLSEFKGGERVRILPKCHHGFHVKCIDKWLCSHSSCPTCRQSLVDTCQKIIGCDDDHHQATPLSSSSSREIIGISIEPLEREGLVRN